MAGCLTIRISLLLIGSQALDKRRPDWPGFPKGAATIRGNLLPTPADRTS